MIVLGAIGVLLIIMLTAVGLLMYSAKAKPEAPLRSPCPDYWAFDGSGCKFSAGGTNIGQIATGASQTPGFDSPGAFNAANITYKTNNDYFLNPTSTAWATKYKGLTEVCAKGKWATDLGIVWDGYTNTTEC